MSFMSIYTKSEPQARFSYIYAFEVLIKCKIKFNLWFIAETILYLF